MIRMTRPADGFTVFEGILSASTIDDLRAIVPAAPDFPPQP